MFGKSIFKIEFVAIPIANIKEQREYFTHHNLPEGVARGLLIQQLRAPLICTYDSSENYK